MAEISNNIRKFNRCSVFGVIALHGPISRASIAKKLGLSKQTLSEIAKQLEDEGWICPVGMTQGAIGRAAVNYEVVSDAAYVAAVDVGGTKTSVAIADLSCDIFSEISLPTDRRGGIHVVEQIAELCTQVMMTSNLMPDKLKLAVIGVPGVPDSKTGHVQMAPNIPDLDKFDFARALRETLKVDIIVENDVNLAALGERWGGAAQHTDDLAYIALGTGIGAGLIVGGELLRGRRGSSGEIGYLPFGTDPFAEDSQRKGALENATATSAIRRKYEKHTGRLLDVKAIFDQLPADKAAAAVLDDVARDVARACLALVAITDPEAIILGGSIGRRMELFERVKHYFSRLSNSETKLGIGALGGRAALVGAASLGLSQIHATLLADTASHTVAGFIPTKLAKPKLSRGMDG